MNWPFNAAAAALMVASGVSAQPLQTAPGSRPVGVRVAEIRADGSYGHWIDYAPSRDLLGDTIVFDCYEPDLIGAVSGEVGAPIGYFTCGLGEPEDAWGERWFFGTTANNPFATNDMTVAENTKGTFINDLAFAWWWGGPAGVDRNCFVEISFFDSNAIADNTGECDTPIQRDDPSLLGGILVDFGPLTGNPGHYWYAVIEDMWTGLGVSIPIPTDRVGAYQCWIGTYTTDPQIDGVLDVTAEGGTQMMLWGTGDAEAFGGVADDRPGTNNEWHWEDRFLSDGFHQAPEECRDYGFKVCPDPLGAMLAVWVPVNDGCKWDLDGDSDTDFDDLVILLAGYGSIYTFQDLIGFLGSYGCS